MRKVTLISGRTSQQGVGLEVGKTSDQYFESAALIELSVADAEALGVEEGQPVEVSTAHGSVVVRSRPSKGLDEGMAFFPYGLWANQVFGSKTEGTGMPSYKGIEAAIKTAEDKQVPSLSELVAGLRGEN
ncbi:MAG: tRNA CCA-pyrophosphorylase [Candidatus Bathyarchaeota archaeon]|nr:MAG: tRNA CCA-pyrophosphorylase [Candidatus Bathyarchaeota archaeon]